MHSVFGRSRRATPYRSHPGGRLIGDHCLPSPQGMSFRLVPVQDPASVTVAAGATSATFTVSTKSQKVSTTVTISAKLGTVTKTAVLTVTK